MLTNLLDTAAYEYGKQGVSDHENAGLGPDDAPGVDRLPAGRNGHTRSRASGGRAKPFGGSTFQATANERGYWRRAVAGHDVSPGT